MSFLSRLSRLVRREEGEDEFKKTLRELDRMAREAVREQELVIKGKRGQVEEWALGEEESIFPLEEFAG
jgi:hypothetical protein